MHILAYWGPSAPGRALRARPGGSSGPPGGGGADKGGGQSSHIPYIYIYIYIYIDIYKYIYLYVCMYVLWHGVTLNPWPPQEPTPLRFPVWLGIPKPMIPYPLLWEGAVRTVGSHLGRIPNCSEVPDNPPPPPREPREPREQPSPAPLPEPPPLQAPPPPPLGASGRQLVGGVVGVQDRGVAPPRGCRFPRFAPILCPNLLNSWPR